MPDAPSTITTIPAANPKLEFEELRAEIENSVTRVFESGFYILGPECEEFEREFAAYLGLDHCIGVANGTDAIAIALRAVGVEPGDEVITVSHSAVATVAAVEQIGAIPVFADIDPLTRCMDPSAVEDLISEKTKAVLPVHIYGQPAAIQEIVEVAHAHSIKVVEDCAQAHGALVGTRRVGTFGDAAAFSFYPTKNLGAIGDGGAVATSSSETAEKARLLKQYGWKKRYVSEIAGVNSRLDELQAAILRVKLRHLDRRTARRIETARRYTAALPEGIKGPSEIPGTGPVFHLYVVQSPKRDNLMAYMKGRGIMTALHYPLAIHQQAAYRGRIRGYENLPCTENLYREIVSLPMFPDLTDAEVIRVVQALMEYGE